MSNINSASQTVQIEARVQDKVPSPDKPFTLKVILLGDYGVGKTAFVKQLCEGQFVPEHNSTISVDFQIKELNIHGKHRMRVEVWDTGGQERFRAITPMYIRVADGLILFYDITHRNSFINIPSWVEFIKETLGDEPYVLMLIGSKADKNGRQVEEEEGQKLAKGYNALFFEVSSKTGENIEDSFYTLAEKLHHKNVEKYKKEIFQKEEAGHDDKGTSCTC